VIERQQRPAILPQSDVGGGEGGGDDGVGSEREDGAEARRRKEILERLRALAPEGAPLPASALPRDLYSAILARFGSIARARQAAGLAASLPRRRRWSEEAVVEELRRLHGLGLRIRDRELKEAGHSGVVEAAQIYCGGLARARRLARISDERRSARKREPWDAERVLTEIRALRAAGQSLARSRVDPRLYLAARRYFGAWGNAVEAAGERYERVRLNAPSLPVEQLLEQLRALAAERPAMSASELEAHSLGSVLRRRFPSLAAAVRDAGIAAWPRRERSPLPTAEETLRRIRGRDGSGRSVARSDVRREDRSLLRAAERHFGAWQVALEAAGAASGVGKAGKPGKA